MQQTEQHNTETPSTSFFIGSQEIRRRNKNLLWGLLLSILLSAVIIIENYRDPITYNNTLLWSILIFLILANLINYLRFLRYLRLIRKHSVVVHQGKILFHTDDNVSELDVSNISLMQLYRGSTRLLHIQLRLKNNRGIRLEGYDRLELMAEFIAEQLQPEQVTESKAIFG